MQRNQDPIHGFIYQLKLLMLFLHKGIQCKYKFYLRTEMKEAGCFDDLIFQYERNGKKIFRLLQAKHNLDNRKKITTADLLSDSTENQNYCLIKYFHSYVKSKGQKLFKGGSFEDLIICTNAAFDMDDLKKYPIQVDEVTKVDDILCIKRSDEEIKPKRYRFHETFADILHDKLLKSFNHLQIAKKLVECILDNKLIHKKQFSGYSNALTYEVIDKNNKRLFEKFVLGNELSCPALNFRNLFEDALKKQTGGNLDLKKLNELIKNGTPFKEKTIQLNIHPSFGRGAMDNLWPDDKISKADVEEFVNLLMFAVEINEDELGKAIKNEILFLNQLNEITTEYIYNKLFQHMIHFLQDKENKQGKKVEFWSHEQGETFLKNACFEIIILQLSGYRDHLDSIKSYFNETLSEKMKDFTKSEKQLWLLTSETPWLSTLAVYQSIKDNTRDTNFFIFQWSDLLNNYRKVLDFMFFDNFLIIISCLQLIGTESVISEIVEKIKKLISEQQSTSKKIIVVASKKHRFRQQLLNFEKQLQFFSENFFNIEFNDMDDRSQRLLFKNENITFQGIPKLSLEKLLNIEDQKIQQESKKLNLDASDIEVLLRNEEVEIFNHTVDFSSLIYKPNMSITLDSIRDEIKICENDDNNNDIFVFYGNDEEINITFHEKEIDLISFNFISLSDKNIKYRCILLELENEEKDFNTLCRRVYDYAQDAEVTNKPALHKLKYIGKNEFIWVQTFNVEFYIPRSFKNCNNLFEDEFIPTTDRVILLADGPGTGKSSSLMRIILKLKNLKPTSLVVHIDMNKLQRCSDLCSGRSENDFIELLFRVFKKSGTRALEKKVIMYKMKYPEQLILLFDGFDEVVVEKQKSALGLFKFIRQDTEAQMWITTRTQTEGILVKSLDVVKHSFDELSFEDKHSYLRTFLVNGLTFCKMEKNSRTEYVRALLKDTDHFDVSFQNFNEVPLMLRFICEKYMEIILKDYATINVSDMKEKISKINIAHTFKAFVFHMYETYFVEKIKIIEWFDDESKAILSDAYSLAYRCLAGNHMIESFDNNFPEDMGKNISSVTLSKIGLIKTFGNRDGAGSSAAVDATENSDKEINDYFIRTQDKSVVRFIHPLLEIYFAAEFVYCKLKTCPSKEILWKFLIDELLCNPFAQIYFENKLAEDKGLLRLSSNVDQKKLILKLYLAQEKWIDFDKTLWNCARNNLREIVTFLSNFLFMKDNVIPRTSDILRLGKDGIKEEKVINYIMNKRNSTEDIGLDYVSQNIRDSRLTT